MTARMTARMMTRRSLDRSPFLVAWLGEIKKWRAIASQAKLKCLTRICKYPAGTFTGSSPAVSSGFNLGEILLAIVGTGFSLGEILLAVAAP